MMMIETRQQLNYHNLLLGSFQNVCIFNLAPGNVMGFLIYHNHVLSVGICLSANSSKSDYLIVEDSKRLVVPCRSYLQVLPELTTCFETVVSQLSLVLLSSCLSGLLRTLTSTAYVLRVCLNEFSGRVLKSILDCGREKVTCSSKEKEGPGGNDTNSAELW